MLNINSHKLQNSEKLLVLRGCDHLTRTLQEQPCSFDRLLNLVAEVIKKNYRCSSLQSVQVAFTIRNDEPNLTIIWGLMAGIQRDIVPDYRVISDKKYVSLLQEEAITNLSLLIYPTLDRNILPLKG